MPVSHPASAPPPLPAGGQTPLIAVQDLSFSYHDGLPALRGVSFSLQRGEKVALVGPNGAGKSTLMLHLNGLLGDERSPVTVAGLSLARANLPLIRARVGLVFQNPDDQLFSPTVFDDVAYGPLYMGLPEEEVRRRVALALTQVGLTGLEERLSHHLSTGQKKRAAIATVLAMDPELLVLDEPTAALDPRGRRELMALLRELPVSLLVSTHDMALAYELFPRIIVLDEGRVVADGATAVILADAPFLEAHGLEAPCL